MHHSFRILRDWLCFMTLVGTTVVVMSVVAACKVSKWQLITAGEHPHTPAFLAVSFTDRDHGWGLTPTVLLKQTTVEELGLRGLRIQMQRELSSPLSLSMD